MITRFHTYLLADIFLAPCSTVYYYCHICLFHSLSFSPSMDSHNILRLFVPSSIVVIRWSCISTSLSLTLWHKETAATWFTQSVRWTPSPSMTPNFLTSVTVMSLSIFERSPIQRFLPPCHCSPSIPSHPLSTSLLTLSSPHTSASFMCPSLSQHLSTCLVNLVT